MFPGVLICGIYNYMKVKLKEKFKYRVEAGESEQDIFLKFNTCRENVFRNNPNIPLFAGEWIEIQVNDFLTHIVKPLETIDDVCRIYHITKEELKTLNALESERLFIGQRLKIKK